MNIKTGLLCCVLSLTAVLGGQAQSLSIYQSVEIEVPTEPGHYYQLQWSQDLETWSATGDPFLGTGGIQIRSLRTADGNRFVRSVETEPIPSMEEDVIFQHSTLGALLVGLYESDFTFDKLLPHGNLGLGTFQGVDGELIITDGKAYRVRVDGSVTEVLGDTKTPFAVVTFFEPDLVVEFSNVTDFAQFQSEMDRRLPSKNLLYSMRITGLFNTLVTRSVVAAQERPYPPFADVVAEQQVFEFQNITGTMVGFRFPSYVANINAIGHHLHFISADHSSGGHILDFSGSAIRVEVDMSSRLEMDLPTNEEFLNADLN